MDKATQNNITPHSSLEINKYKHEISKSNAKKELIQVVIKI